MSARLRPIAFYMTPGALVQVHYDRSPWESRMVRLERVPDVGDVVIISTTDVVRVVDRKWCPPRVGPAFTVVQTTSAEP